MLSRGQLVDIAERATSTRLRRLGVAAAAYLLLTLVWFAPVAFDFTSTILRGPADSTLTIRSSWATGQTGHNPFTATHDYLNGAPEGIPYLSAVTWTAPIQGGTTLLLSYLVGWVGAFNLFLLLGFVLTGFFTFWLLDRLGYHPLVSFLGGYVIAFNPWMFERAFAGHAAFNHAWIYPALILALLLMSEQRTMGSAAMAGLAFGISFWIASYFGLIAALIIGVYFLFELIRVGGWAERLWTLTLACTTAFVPLLMLLPGLIKYALDHDRVSATISNSTIEAQRLGAEAASYVLPSASHPVFGDLTRSYEPSRNFAETTLFFGYTTIVLAVIGLALVIRRHPVGLTTPLRRRALVFAAFLLPLAFWASLRSVVRPFGLWIPTLSYFVTHVTTYYRVYARFGIIVGLALVLLAAPVLERIVRRPRWGVPLLAGLCLLVAFELLPGRVTAWAAKNPPVHDRWLADQPRGIVAHYPLPTDQKAALHLGEREIYHQMFHKQPLYNIFGPGTGDTREEGIRILSRYITDPLTPGILRAERVTYVLVHDDVYREQKQEPPTLGPEFVPIRRFPNVRVFRLAPDVEPVELDPLLEQQAGVIAAVQGLPAPEATFVSGFSTPLRGADAWRRLEGVGTIELEHDDPILKRSQLVFTARSEGVPRVIEITDARGHRIGQFLVPIESTQYIVGPIRTPGGRTRVTVQTSPAGTRESGVLIGPLTPQPLSDFSLSLRAS